MRHLNRKRKISCYYLGWYQYSYVALIKILSQFFLRVRELWQEKTWLEVVILPPFNLHFLQIVFILVLRAGKGSLIGTLTLINSHLRSGYFYYFLKLQRHLRQWCRILCPKNTLERNNYAECRRMSANSQHECDVNRPSLILVLWEYVNTRQRFYFSNIW